MVLMSPEKMAGGGEILTPEDCAERAIERCHGLEAAVGWARTWAHRPYFREVLKVLKAKGDEDGEAND